MMASWACSVASLFIFHGYQQRQRLLILVLFILRAVFAKVSQHMVDIF
jgi:hypothetical protein